MNFINHTNLFYIVTCNHSIFSGKDLKLKSHLKSSRGEFFFKGATVLFKQLALLGRIKQSCPSGLPTNCFSLQ